MGVNRIIGNMAIAGAAQLVSMITSMLTSLLVPKVLGVEGFGYWQLFIFYFNYVGACQLGINDGVYLLRGGQDRRSLDREETGGIFWNELVLQCVIALTIAAFAVLSQPEASRLFVLVACAALLPLYNCSCFFQYLFQAIDETRITAKAVMVDRALVMVLTVLLVLFRVGSFEWYVYSFAVGKVAYFIYFFGKGRGLICRVNDTVLGGSLGFIGRCIRVGLPLMLANLASSLILGVLRFFIDTNWGIEVFGKVSLAISLASFFLTLTTQVTMVLFPVLRKLGPETVGKFYHLAQDALELSLPSILLLYIPVRALLDWWLPEYASSFDYLGLILPLCVFDGKMNALYSTMLKVRRMERLLLVINVFALLLSAIAACAGAYLFRSVELVLMGGSCAVIFRSVISSAVLSYSIDGRASVNIPEIALVVLFWVAFRLLPGIQATITYAIGYGIYLISHKETLVNTISQIENVFGRR